MSTLTVDRDTAHPAAPVPASRLLSVRTLVNVMLVFAPLALVGELLHLGGVFVFVCSALACVPLSYWLGQSTESLGSRLGPVSGGLLNATFGNAAELIISVMALSHGLFVVVRTSLIGSILGQLLLVLGTSLIVAGMRHGSLKFSRSHVQINFTLMALALVAIALPTLLLSSGSEQARSSLNVLTPILAVVLLIVYAIVYAFAVVFSLRTQPEDVDDGSGPQWGPKKGLVVLAVSTGGMIGISEMLVGSILPLIEATGVSQVFIGMILIPIFSNVVDHIVAITVAMKNRMDLSLTISVGSAAQVACMILPVIVLVSYGMGLPVALVFEPIELLAMGIGIALMVPVLLDGRSNWLEGAQLLGCYAILGTVLWAF